MQLHLQGVEHVVSGSSEENFCKGRFPDGAGVGDPGSQHQAGGRGGQAGESEIKSREGQGKVNLQQRVEGLIGKLSPRMTISEPMDMRKIMGGRDVYQILVTYLPPRPDRLGQVFVVSIPVEKFTDDFMLEEVKLAVANCEIWSREHRDGLVKR